MLALFRPRASMGPRRYRRGNRLIPGLRPIIERASMGPRRYRRGNVVRYLYEFADALASMGPRRYRRGNSAISSRCAAQASRFNGAATLSSRKSALRRELQIVDPASMGPRRYRRGNTINRCSTRPPTTASMGPRRYRRGNSLWELYESHAGSTLQWGRDVIVAEISSWTQRW